jgi:phage terminase large subunit-like protein
MCISVENENGLYLTEDFLVTHNTLMPEVELTYHLTGEYPDWWSGYRFEQPITAWEWATTNEKSRDVQQKILLGPGGAKRPGGGLIPIHLIEDISFRQCGLDNVADKILVRYQGRKNKLAILQLKTYAQGREAAQGESIQWIRFDEEPDPNNLKHAGIWGECLTRIFDNDGHLVVTYTPIAGNTEILQHFDSGGDSRWICKAGYWYDWTDVPHLGEVARKRHIDSLPEHERPARCRGEPKLGSGRVFMVSEEMLLCPPFELPPHTFWIMGHDFGLDHAAGSVKLAIDRVHDIWYLTWSSRAAHEQVPYHAATLRMQGPWIPVAWPHDGHKRAYSLGEAGGREIRDLYMAAGANMLPISARYERKKGGAQSSEPIILELNNRARTGRFKIFNCPETLPFREEYRVYHRDEHGKLVPRKDDVLKALFYAGMMQAYAQQREPTFNRPVYSGSMVA